MRDDIEKLICERPRTDGGLSKRYRREVAWSRLSQEGREDDSPDHEPTRKKLAGWRRKGPYSGLLSPILGFLRKNVGRLWDDIWSEVSAGLSHGSATQRHVLGSVLDCVEIRTVEQADGTITDSRGRPLWDRFYVHPSTGVLLQVETSGSRKRWRWEPSFPPTRFHRIDGLWFEVDFARSPVIGRAWSICGRTFLKREKLDEWLKSADSLYRSLVSEINVRENVMDVVIGRMAVFGRRTDRAGFHWLDDGDLYCSAKRQAGKKAIRLFGLRDIAGDHGGPIVVVPASM